jgi:phage terminase Nu1 subunit (DNA packaging protein)
VKRLVKTQVEVARFFQVTERTVSNWKKSGMPTKTRGGYDLDAINHWRQTQKYLGASLKACEQEGKTVALFQIAVGELRRGLEHLCAAYLLARGKGRQRLIDQTLKDIVMGTMVQGDLLGEEWR